MVLKEIKWIENQMKKLQEPHFDLDVWKTSACLMLDSIFGANNHRTKQLEQLDNMFNSWSLRDAVGNESYNDRNRRMAAEILQSAKEELEIVGLKRKNTEFSYLLDELLTSIFDELKGSQVRNLKQIMVADLPKEEKKRQVSDILRETGDENLILTKLLLHPSLEELLKKEE
jgi:hypothetical protein